MVWSRTQARFSNPRLSEPAKKRERLKRAIAVVERGTDHVAACFQIEVRVWSVKQTLVRGKGMLALESTRDVAGVSA